MDRTSEQQQKESTMNFDRPHGAPKIEPSHALMAPDVAAIVFGGKLLEGENLWNVCTSMVEQDRHRLAAQDAAKKAVGTPTERRRHGRLLVEFLESSTTAGQIAAMSEAMRRDGIENVPAWQLDERGVPFSICIFARD